MIWNRLDKYCHIPYFSITKNCDAVYYTYPTDYFGSFVNLLFNLTTSKKVFIFERTI